MKRNNYFIYWTTSHWVFVYCKRLIVPKSKTTFVSMSLCQVNDSMSYGKRNQFVAHRTYGLVPFEILPSAAAKHSFLLNSMNVFGRASMIAQVREPYILPTILCWLTSPSDCFRLKHTAICALYPICVQMLLMHEWKSTQTNSHTHEEIHFFVVFVLKPVSFPVNYSLSYFFFFFFSILFILIH